uniref:Transmembrane p24 trafficking protein 3 n=1 Tax=Ailuropoda melanoleuca TaxID=9646 RepID=A0A7N5JB20_AILME
AEDAPTPPHPAEVPPPSRAGRPGEEGRGLPVPPARTRSGEGAGCVPARAAAHPALRLRAAAAVAAPAAAAPGRAAAGRRAHLRAARQRQAVLPRGRGAGRQVLPGLPDFRSSSLYRWENLLCAVVITGGHYDVDCYVEDPLGNTIYRETKKQYDSFTHRAEVKGVYQFCFSNEFSTFSHKTVYFDFQVGDEPPILPDMGNRVTALTQMESACVTIHEALKTVIDSQTHYRLREAQDRARAEDLNSRVSYWSVGETVALFVGPWGQIGIAETEVLWSFGVFCFRGDTRCRKTV